MNLLFIIGIVMTGALFVTGAAYVVYRIAFDYDPKRRANPHVLSKSPQYRGLEKIFEQAVHEMEETPAEHTDIISKDGLRLHGRLYSFAGEAKDAPVVLFFHGYHGTYCWDGYGTFCLCRDEGYNLLMVDERAHGDSEGRTISFGIREKEDCKAWMQEMIRRYGKDVCLVLSGVSMGAATVLMAAAEETSGNLKAVISDCSYSSPREIICKTIRDCKLPEWPVYPLVRLGARLFGKFDPDCFSPVKAMEKIKIPVLLIHGDEDETVPVAMCEQIFAAGGDRKKQWIAKHAGHAVSAAVDYAAWKEQVVLFLRELL